MPTGVREFREYALYTSKRVAGTAMIGFMLEEGVGLGLVNIRLKSSLLLNELSISGRPVDKPSQRGVSEAWM